MNVFHIQCIVQLLVVFIISVTNAAPALDTIWHQHANRIQTGLYAPTDHVVVLDSTNLNDTIYGSKNAWIVEFYANWCPHCQRFATVWKTFSESIDNWKDIVNVGAFDCATVENTPFCHKYEVATVPAIKYFSPYSKPGTLGHEISKSEIVQTLREKIIDSLESDQEKGNNVAWPNLEQLRSLNSTNVFHGLSTTIKYYVIIFEEPKSYLGLTTILDFHNVSEIQIGRVSSNNKQLCDQFKVKSIPTLLVIDRNNFLSNLTLSVPSRTEVYNKIKHFLHSTGITINTIDVRDDLTIMQNYTPKRNINYAAVKLKDDNIYQIDLESALQYSLKQEISLAKNISDEKMVALKNYLKVLVDYFPRKHDSLQYLEDIYDAVKNESSIDGQEFHDLLTKLNKDSNEIRWVGCMGTLPHSRRYTCGLWTMFHTLSVKYAIAVDENQSETDIGGKVILAMYDYAKHFFGCSHCAEHFVDMAKKRNINNVKTANEAVLWLWKAHNEVNLRLSGDVTEDPEYPKIQYPAKVHCPTCRNADDSWNEVEVMKYLKEKYGARIKYDVTM